MAFKFGERDSGDYIMKYSEEYVTSLKADLAKATLEASSLRRCCRDHTDQIAALKTELADTQAAASIHADEHRKARDEIVKLREALEEIKSNHPDGWLDAACACRFVAIARKALKK